jgi:hypothetical protein
MSLKKWKLVLASLSVAFFAACAGSSNAGSSDAGYTGSTESNDNSSSYTGYGDNDEAKPVVQQKKEAPKEVINEKTLKKTQDEASAANEDNHKLRKEIFEARTKLGLPIQQPSTDAE